MFLRSYYRCSSSKSCLARKQVERSHTDPNMLVNTYISEHNHPCPTQRKALAGSSRSSSTSKSSAVTTSASSRISQNKDEPNKFHFPFSPNPLYPAEVVKEEDVDGNKAAIFPELLHEDLFPNLDGDSLTMLSDNSCGDNMENKTISLIDSSKSL